MANLLEDFKSAYNDLDLQENYYIHRLSSTHPYKTLAVVDEDKNNIVDTAKANLRTYKQEEKKKWKNRKNRQIAIMKIIIQQLQNNSDNTNNYNFSKILTGNTFELIKNFNQLYYDYIQSTSATFSQQGYVNVTYEKALRVELNQLYGWLKSINFVSEENYKKSNNISNETVRSVITNYFLQLTDNNLMEQKFKQYLDNRAKDLEKEKQTKEKIKDEKSRNGALKLIKFQQEVINYFKNTTINKTIATTIVSDTLNLTGSKINAQEVGRRVEAVFAKILNNIFSKGFSGTIRATQQGTEQNKTIINNEVVQYTVKTDVGLVISSEAIDQLKTILSSEEVTSLKNNRENAIINFSLKNYDPSGTYDISAQSNNSFDTFLNIMNERDKNNPLSFIKGPILEDFRYFILNENVNKTISDEFMSEISQIFSELGMEVMFALNDATDEIDFLNINQCIIPAFYLEERIEQERENNNKVFSIHTKTTIPSVESKKAIEDYEPYYHKNFLAQFKKTGEQSYKKFYVHTKINRNFIFKLMGEINDAFKPKKTGGN